MRIMNASNHAWSATDSPRFRWLPALEETIGGLAFRKKEVAGARISDDLGLVAKQVFRETPRGIGAEEIVRPDPAFDRWKAELGRDPRRRRRDRSGGERAGPYRCRQRSPRPGPQVKLTAGDGIGPSGTVEAGKGEERGRGSCREW
jgi:hypothetical protein